MMPGDAMMRDADLDAAESVHRPARPVGFTVLAAALTVGIAIGWRWDDLSPWVWLVPAGALGVLAIVCRARRVVSLMCLAAAMLCLGAAWVNIRRNFVPHDNLAAMLGDEPTLLRVRGHALRPPRLHERASGSMALFDYRGPATYFTLRVESIIDRAGAAHEASGTLLVRVMQTVPPFRAGDAIEATGMAYRPASALNPGEFDYEQFARTLGQAGMLVVENRELLHITRSEHIGLIDRLTNAREAMRQRAGGWLLAHLPRAADPDRDALLEALLLGTRGPELDGVGETFRRVGLAHVLAISGFHLGVLAGFIALLLRLCGGSHRLHAWIVIVAVICYLLLLDAQLPVLRAGVMVIAGSLGIALGRSLAVGGLVSLSAIILLMWMPDQVVSPGFQLSYGVVLGLIHLSPSVRQRWFGPRNVLAASSSQMLGEWLKSATAAAMTAWAIASPIVMYHYGELATLAAPLTVITLPLVSTLLAVGFVKIVIAAMLPSASLLLGLPLSICTEVLISLVEGIDSIKYSMLAVPFPSLMWTFAALVWVCAWCLATSRRWRRALWLIAAPLLLAWIIVPEIRAWWTRPALRIDMLAVGDGSCYALRSGGRTVVFDAGSTTAINAGRLFIVPTMRRLGIRSIDEIFISHANLDHYSAVIELAESFDVARITVTPQFIRVAESEPDGPVAYLIDVLTDRGCAIHTASAADVRTIGECTWRWLHPASDFEHELINNCSSVIRIDVAGGRRVMLCGDAQREALAMLLEDPAAIDVDVIELPHHGSHSAVAESFVAAASPLVVMQSTGPLRMRNDRWSAALASVERMVTCRDGQCTIEVDDDGGVAVQKFVKPPMHVTPAVPEDPPNAESFEATSAVR
jgi:competence protein ComEC